MKPNELSAVLRRMASAIESSKNPSKSAVARDLKKVLDRVASPFFYDSPGAEEGPAEDSSGMCAELNSQGIKLMSGTLMKSGRELTLQQGQLLDIDVVMGNTVHFKDGGTCTWNNGHWE
jgi:hypothetical protein